MTEYSQDREQTAIFEALRGEDAIRDSTQETVIEIGSWHPFTFSNSRALIECGWKAILVEPSPGPMASLLDEYGNNDRVKLIQAAIGMHENLVQMHITDDAVSTSESGVYEQWKNATKFRGSMYVPVITLERLVSQFGGACVWSLDAEGLSVDLFTRMMVLQILPPVVVVEHDNRMVELLQMATKHGYVCTFSNATNVVLKSVGEAMAMRMGGVGKALAGR